MEPKEWYTWLPTQGERQDLFVIHELWVQASLPIVFMFFMNDKFSFFNYINILCWNFQTLASAYTC